MAQEGKKWAQQGSLMGDVAAAHFFLLLRFTQASCEKPFGRFFAAAKETGARFPLRNKAESMLALVKPVSGT
jgi:hypothetical protein